MGIEIGIDVQRLAAAVIESGMGEVQICARAGVAHQTFAKMLKGQMVRFPSIGRICNILNLRPAEILREVPQHENLQAQGQSVLASSAWESANQPAHESQSAGNGIA